MPAMIAVDDDELRREAFGPVGVVGLDHPAKQGRDRDPPLGIHLVGAFTSEYPSHVRAGLFSVPPDGKRRADPLPPINPPPSSRLAGDPTARATWGDVCSLARRNFFYR